MECTYCKDEFCTNDECPMCGDYCPVPDDEGVCRYEVRKEEIWKLTPKGCLAATIARHTCIDEEIIDALWHDFEELMTLLGYVEE